MLRLFSYQIYYILLIPWYNRTRSFHPRQFVISMTTLAPSIFKEEHDDCSNNSITEHE